MTHTTLPSLTRTIDDAFLTTWFEIREEAIDNILDATVIWGNEEQIQAKMKQWLSYGFGELMAHPVIVGTNRETALLATMEVIATAAQQD